MSHFCEAEFSAAAMIQSNNHMKINTEQEIHVAQSDSNAWEAVWCQQAYTPQW